MSFRAAFLITAAAVILHISAQWTLLLLAGYLSFAQLDTWLSRRARKQTVDEILDDVMSGWTIDPEDATLESKGGLCRRKLPDKEQIILDRVGELLRRMIP